jgi:acetyl esterase/lipase
LQLDVYIPPSATGARPVLFFIYGGGFVTGDKIIPASNGLVYANAGAFFANRGYVAVIPDYRLAPAVTYPAQEEDIRDAILWTVAHADELSRGSVTLDVNTLVVMGHSAGGCNVACLFFHAALLAETDIRERIKALILNGVAYHWNGPPPLPRTNLAPYYGSAEEQADKEALTLFNVASSGLLEGLPPILLVEAEKEPRVIKKSIEDFITAYGNRMSAKEGGSTLKRIVAEGHNHISVNWALMTGDGEEWADEVSRWLSAKLAIVSIAVHDFSCWLTGQFQDPTQ